MFFVLRRCSRIAKNGACGKTNVVSIPFGESPMNGCPNTLAFLDVETTGHDPLRLVNSRTKKKLLTPWHEIIDIGCVFADERSLDVVGEFSKLIKPEHPERCITPIVNHYPERAKRGEWDNAVTLRQGVLDFLECIGGHKGEGVVFPLGHNFTFDWSFFSVAFALCGIEEKEWSKYLHYARGDTHAMALQELTKPDEAYNPNAFSLRSGKLQQALGLPPEPEPHLGLNGAYQAYYVFKALRELRAKRV